MSDQQSPDTPRTTSPLPTTGPADTHMTKLPSTNETPPTFVSLPTELHLIIFGYLQDEGRWKDLFGLVQTCKTTNWPATDLLYRHIEVDFVQSPPEDREFGRFLALIHSLLLEDRDYSTSVRELNVQLAWGPPGYARLTDTQLQYSLGKYGEYVALVRNQIDEAMGTPSSSPILDMREAMRLVIKRCTGLRHILVGSLLTNTHRWPWNLELHSCNNLKTIKLPCSGTITLPMIVDLARIPGLTSLLLPLVPQLDEAARPFTEERIHQAQFRKLTHLKLLRFPRNSWIMPDLITMVPELRDLELEYAWWPLADDGDSPPLLPLSTLLCTGNSSPLMPAPRLGETLEKLRVYGIGWDGWEMDLDWGENLFGSLKFLRRLKVLEIPVQAPIDKLLHLLPDSLEELHLASTSGPSYPSEWLVVVSEAMTRLALVGLHSLRKIFLKLSWRDHVPQKSRDMLHITCSELGIELKIVADHPAFI